MFFSNIIGFDGIIIMFSIVNVLIIVFPIRNISINVQKQLKKVVYLPIADLMEKINQNGKKESLDLNDLMHLHQRSEKLYQMFLAITSILPLLGILGTVIALLNTANADIETLKANFTFALTSTYWGLIGAIVCKVLEGVISPAVAHNGQFIEILMSRLDSESAK